MPWRTTALALALSFFAAGVFAQHADLKRDTAKVCSNLGTPAEKKNCAAQQDAMSATIAKMGAGAFKRARDQCPARR